VTVFECNACNKSSISTSACTLSSSRNREKQLKLYNLQEDAYVISTQKHLAVKKSAACSKMASVKKVVKSTLAAKKWL